MVQDEPCNFSGFILFFNEWAPHCMNHQTVKNQIDMSKYGAGIDVTQKWLVDDSTSWFDSIVIILIHYGNHKIIDRHDREFVALLK